MKRCIGIFLSALLLIALTGCGRKATPQSSPLPSPTLASNDTLSITGKVDLTMDKDENAYVVTYTGSIPDGAFVNFYLLDDAGNMLDFTSDVICRNGKCQATFDADSAIQTARANKSDKVFARAEFFPGDKSQPAAIRDKFGDKGSKLAGDNLIRDDSTGESGVRMESGELGLP